MRQAPRHQGFVLLVVVFILAMMAVGLTIWVAQTKDLMIQTKLHTVQAGLDNAIASTGQWLQINSKTLTELPEGEWIPLDCGLEIHGLECRYRVVDKNADSTEVEITATGNFRSHSIKKTVRLSL